MLTDKLEHVVLDEHQVGDVLQQLGIGVALDVFLGNRLPHTLDPVFVETGLAQ